ncbi:MAG: HU family DNA-binding protein [Bacteroidales bacterium]|nr:HU family DNA-binding protein [Bacteroidales bacterium]
MNETAGKNRLKQIIINESGMEPAFVNIFIDNMLDIIAESIENGENISIEGIGEFRTVSFEKGNKKRVVFIPDQIMRSRVNAPFEAFEPLVIEEAHPENHISVINSSQDEEENKIEKLNSQLIVNNTDSDDILQNNYSNNETPMDKNENERDPHHSEKWEEKENKQYEKQIEEVEAPVEVYDGDANLTEEVDQAVVKPYKEIEKEIGCKDESCSPIGFGNRKSTLIGAVILLAIVILGAIIYFVYVVEKDDKPNQNIGLKAEVITPKTNIENGKDAKTFSLEDSLSNDKKLDLVQQNAASNQTEKQSDSVVSVIKPNSNSLSTTDNENKPNKGDFNFPINIVLNNGGRLTLLSQKYYGHKAFWVYIFLENKNNYSDPNNIPSGAELTIPSPEKYNINVQNTASLNKAKQMAVEILSK